ncbi:MAG TPA: phospholipase D-like domain-containing protein [Acidimicrobiales bacterium]|nr:phospholipase D-like domain-containing protein [Acidimicrobiales bacterium]
MIQVSDPTTTDSVARVRRTLEGVLGVPATEGNAITVLRNGDEIFPAMLDAIDRAQHTLDFLTFVYWAGDIGKEVGDHLAERASAGVRVRVLLDAWGSHTMDKAVIDRMESAGARVHWFRPLHRLRLGQMNHRTHRKVLIADEAVGFTGGVGIADCWRGDARDESEWRDTHFRVEGPAVDGLRAAFLDNWAETETELFDESVDRFPDQPQPGSSVVQCIRGASETGWSDVATMFRSLLQLAEERVRIATAYFVPNEELTDRFSAARERGVEIDILLPGPHADKRFVQLAGEAEYATLLDCGVRVWNFQPSMLHAKVMTVDGRLANIGSANLNTRSVYLDEEINVLLIDDDVVATLDAQFDEDLERSIQIEPGRWSERSLLQRAREKLVTPIRRLF